MKEEDIKKLIKEMIKQELKSGLFSARKLTDTPTDDLMVTPRRYVNLNGVTSSRPTSSIVGQQYFDITLGYPIYANGNNWVNSVASVVG